MEVLYLLIPIAVLFLLVIVLGFFWAIRSGQFDDLQGPAHEVLMDDDGIKINETDSQSIDPDADKNL
ncbi:cbb3-type cytochrome oxidase assembly protein CcoS [Pseudomonadota bacterium]